MTVQNGRKTKIFITLFSPLFLLPKYMCKTYTSSMNTKSSPQSVLHDLAQIQHMERGALSVIRQGPDGPYYNHQCYEEGKNVSRYVPSSQVDEIKEAIEGYHR